MSKRSLELVPYLFSRLTDPSDQQRLTSSPRVVIVNEGGKFDFIKTSENYKYFSRCWILLCICKLSYSHIHAFSRPNSEWGTCGLMLSFGTRRPKSGDDTVDGGSIIQVPFLAAMNKSGK